MATGAGREVARLKRRWESGEGWPKRLDWLEISGIRGWNGERFELKFPIMAVVGENGVGKSTILQSAASVYAAESGGKNRFAPDFFLDTPWERIQGAQISYSLREGTETRRGTITKKSDRWRKAPEQRRRNVEYVDLTRVQPVSARAGYAKIATIKNTEGLATPFDEPRLDRMRRIMGRDYGSARTTTVTSNRNRPVIVLELGAEYSGFHQGAGETTIAELLRADLPRYSLVLIDEIESSLHPRAQRRLVRDLAERCREQELQVVLTTHSPYVLQELPLEARCCILQEASNERRLVYGVSPDFAMSRMDEQDYPECDVYVEDDRAKTMLQEIITVAQPELRRRCSVTPYGAASVGRALGQMVSDQRFNRKTCVYLDGDIDAAPGCVLLPGGDPPEIVVFEALRDLGFKGIHNRVGRPYSEVYDACTRAMLDNEHHDWVTSAASALTVGGDQLWQAMCAEWATVCLDAEVAASVVQPVADLVEGITPEVGAPAAAPPLAVPSHETRSDETSPSPEPPSETLPLFAPPPQ